MAPRHDSPAIRTIELDQRENRQRAAKAHYKQWLQHMTRIAVEKALQLQAADHQSGRQPVGIVVDPQSSSKPSLGCSEAFSSLYIPQLQKSSSSRSRDWSLDRNCEDRRHVAAKIYALLVQWRPDFSFEWRAKVAAAVHILEEALYREAKTRDDYTNPLLLDLQLHRVLGHFEAGNGLFLLQGASPIYPVRTYRNPLVESCAAAAQSSAGSSPEIATTGVTASAMSGESPIIPGVSQRDASIDESLEWARANLPSKGTVASLMLSEMRSSRRMEANCALWDAVVAGERTLLEEGLQSHGEYASKRIVKRVINMISRRRREESKRLKQGNGKAKGEPSGQKSAKGKGRCASKPALKGNQGSEKALRGKEAGGEDASGDGGRRKRSGKTLGEMLKFDQSLPVPSAAARGSASTSCSGLMLNPSREVSLLANDTSSIAPDRVVVSGTESAALDANSRCMSELQAIAVDCFHKPTPLESFGGYRDTEMLTEESSSSSPSTCEKPVTSAAQGMAASGSSHSGGEAHEEEEGVGAMFLACSSSLVSLEEAVVVARSKEVMEGKEEQHRGSSRASSSSSQGAGGAEAKSRTAFGGEQGEVEGGQEVAESRALASAHGEAESTRATGGQAVVVGEQGTAKSTAEAEVEAAAEAQAQTQAQAQEGEEISAGEGSSSEAEPEAQAQAQEEEEIGAGERSSSSSSSSSSSGDRERVARVPLSSFLAKREDFCFHTCFEFAPWDFWEEPTEALDPLCCVCMVGLKGAAFVPCGHTFCRKCSRELWRGRGTCPLCNQFIREILDIY